MVAFDGKTECGSKNSPLTENETKHKAIHMVSASTSQGQTSILNLMFCLSFDKKQNNFFVEDKISQNSRLVQTTTFIGEKTLKHEPGTDLDFKPDFAYPSISFSISSFSGITHSAPFFVVINDDAAFAKVSICVSRSSVKLSYPFSRIS